MRSFQGSSHVIARMHAVTYSRITISRGWLKEAREPLHATEPCVLGTAELVNQWNFALLDQFRTKMIN